MWRHSRLVAIRRLFSTFARDSSTFRNHLSGQTKMWQNLAKSIKHQRFSTLRHFSTSNYAGFTAHKYNSKIIRPVLELCRKPSGFSTKEFTSCRGVRTKSSKSDSNSSEPVEDSVSQTVSFGSRTNLQGQFESFKNIFYLVASSLPSSSIYHYEHFVKQLGMEGLFDMVTTGLSTQSINYLIELNQLPYEQFAGLVNKSRKGFLENSVPCSMYEPCVLDMFVETFDSAIKEMHASIKIDQSKPNLKEKKTKKTAKVKSEIPKDIKSEITVENKSQSSTVTDTKDFSPTFLSDEKTWAEVQKIVTKAVNDSVTEKMQTLLKTSDAEKRFISQNEITKLEKSLNKIAADVNSFNQVDFVKSKKFETTIKVLTENHEHKISNVLKESNAFSNTKFDSIKGELKLATKTLKKDTNNAVQTLLNSYGIKITNEIKQMNQNYDDKLKAFESRNSQINSNFLSLKNDFNNLQSKIKNLSFSNDIKSLKADLESIASNIDQCVTREEFDSTVQQLVKTQEAKTDNKVLTVGEFIIIDEFQNKIPTSAMPAEMCKQDVVNVLKGLQNTKRFNRAINKLGKRGFEIVGGTENSVFMWRSPKASRRQRQKRLIKVLLLGIGVTVGVHELRRVGFFDQDGVEGNQEKSALERLIGPIYTYKP